MNEGWSSPGGQMTIAMIVAAWVFIGWPIVKHLYKGSIFYKDDET